MGQSVFKKKVLRFILCLFFTFQSLVLFNWIIFFSCLVWIRLLQLNLIFSQIVLITIISYIYTDLYQVRAMVIINPGNPTGQCLSEANLKEIIHFCYQENLVLLGDEVYQQNIYQDERPFISARKVLNYSRLKKQLFVPYFLAMSSLEDQQCCLLNIPQVLLNMGPPISKEVQLVSFHTVSKGYWGECGQRGGYFEMTNLPPQVICLVLLVCFICFSSLLHQVSRLTKKEFRFPE